MSPYDSQVSHIVTAVIVAHDGARWLPEAVAALRAQTRPVQRVVGVDTGSRDRSGAVLAELLGAESVFGTDRGTGFGTAVAQALGHRAASAPVNAPAGARSPDDAVEWIWLLHDDCAPEPDALERLLVVGASRRFAVLGPKVRKWDDPRVLMEAGLRIDRSGRRVTGLDPDEYDQGQHDGDRDVLAVGSAGMLVRRDVWESAAGFDPALPLLYDDIDFCWRVNAAGHRVRLVTSAVIRHVEAAATGQRPASAGFAEPVSELRRAGRTSALYVLFVNLPLGPMLLSVLRNTAGSLLRAMLALLVVKRPAAAWDEMAALGVVLGRPVRLLLARRRRQSGRRRTYRIFRSSVPRGGVRALFAEIAALGASSGQSRPAHAAGRRGSGAARLTPAVGDAARHRGTSHRPVPGEAAVDKDRAWPDQSGAGRAAVGRVTWDQTSRGWPVRDHAALRPAETDNTARGGNAPDQAELEQITSGPIAPDYAALDRAAPDHAAPDHAAPDHAAPDRAAPDRAAPDRAAPDRAASGRVSPDRAVPGRVSPDRTEWDLAALARAAADGELPPGRRVARRIVTSPGVLTAAFLVLTTAIAGRSLLVGGTLGGGALVPAWGGASSLWHEYLTGFHQIGVGSAAAAPPYVAVLAAVATVLGGKPWLAVDLLLLGSVPLAGITSYLAARRITTWVRARVWAALTYALLPAATGAVAAGRIGTAVTIALTPLIGILAARMLTRSGRRSRRAAWATGLTVAVAAAFVPLAWPIAVAVAALAAFGLIALGGVYLSGGRRATAANLAIVAAVPAVLLFPWTPQLLAHPSMFLTEAGIPRPGLSVPGLPASSLLLLGPGGPGVPPVWVTAGLAAAGAAALLLRRHRVLVVAGWAVAMSGLLGAIVVSRLEAVPPGAGQAAYGWPGVPLMFAGAGVLLAAAAASESLPALLRTGHTGDRVTRHIRRSPPAAPQAVPADRQAVSADGQAVSADGQAVSADGQAVPADGQAVSADGQAVPADGQADRAGSVRAGGPIPGFRRPPGLRAIPRTGVMPRLRGMPSLRAIRRLRHLPTPRAIPGLRVVPEIAGTPLFRAVNSARLRRTGAALVAFAACSAPVLAAGFWIARGAAGPLTRAGSTVLPALVSVSPGSGARPGTLVLRPGQGHLTYAVVRGRPPLPGEAQLPEPAAARRRLDSIVAGLTSGDGGDVGADGNALASFGIGYVLLPAPVDQGLSRVLDGTPGMRHLSLSPAFALWSVTGITARVQVIEPGGAVVPVRSGAVNVQGAAAPGAGGTLVLAEPADGGWHATLNGQPLTALSEPAGGWAQAFKLPPGGGRLDVTRDMTGHHLSVLAEGLALLVVAGLALPGLPSDPGDGDDGATRAARAGAGRRAGRRRHRRRGRHPHGIPGLGTRLGRPAPERVAAPGTADTVSGHSGEPNG